MTLREISTSTFFNKLCSRFKDRLNLLNYSYTEKSIGRLFKDF